MKTLRNLTPEEITALRFSAEKHGRKFKSAIFRAWQSGNYGREGLRDHASTLQRLRNSEDGYYILDSLKLQDLA